LGITALIITVTYKDQEFFRIGYYVYNNYLNPELLENDQESFEIEKVYRNILEDKPRITRFDINWEEKAEEIVENSTLPESCQLSSLLSFQKEDPFSENGMHSYENQNNMIQHNFMDNPFILTKSFYEEFDKKDSFFPFINE